MDKKTYLLVGLGICVLAAFASTAYAGPLTLTPVSPIPGPSFNDGAQFGTLLVGPVSVHFVEESGAFSGWLRTSAFESATNYTFIYRFEMDTPSDSIDLFELATVFPPDLAIDEVTEVGYNTYYTGLNVDATPTVAYSGSEEGYTWLDFSFKDPGNGDFVGLTEGTTTELYVMTTKNVAIDVVYAILINVGASVDETISGVVAFSPPPQEVPEPGTLVFILGGLAGILGAVRTKARAR